MGMDKIITNVVKATPKVMSIVSGKLKPAAPARVFCELNPQLNNEISIVKRDIESYSRLVQEDSKAAPLWKAMLESAQKKLAELSERLNHGPITTVAEYTDSKGARYVETITKAENGMTGTPVRKLEKFEEVCLKDGRKIKIHTTHDKSDMHLMGEGHQDGFIEKVEELQTKEGVTVGRRTTTQLASGYGGKTVEKEVSIDGQELTLGNRKASFSYFNSDGVKYHKSLYEPNQECYGYELECNEKGVPIIPLDSFKYGW